MDNLNIADTEAPFFKHHAKMVLRSYKLRLSLHSIDAESITMDQKIQLESGRYVTRKSEILFPILKADSLYCIGSLFYGQNSDAQVIKKAIEITKLSFEAKLASIHRIETIQQLESVLSQPFHPTRSKTQVIHSLLLESPTELDSFKFAIEFHSQVNRLALLPIEDIDNSSELTLEELKKLKNITLYIRNPESLSKQLQQTIVSYITSPHEPEGPLFIFQSQGHKVPGFVDLIQNRLDKIEILAGDNIKDRVNEFVAQRSGHRIFKIV